MRPARKPSRVRRRCGFLMRSCVAALAAVSACSAPPRERVVSVQQLERAIPSPESALGRALVSDPRRLSGIMSVLSPRLAMVQARSDEEWRLLRATAPELAGGPDFSRGIVIGVVTAAGSSLDGRWPIRIESVRVFDQAGYVCATFEGGSYMPDGVAYVEAAYVPGLKAVVMLDVNGVRYYPP